MPVIGSKQRCYRIGYSCYARRACPDGRGPDRGPTPRPAARLQFQAVFESLPTTIVTRAETVELSAGVRRAGAGVRRGRAAPCEGVAPAPLTRSSPGALAREARDRADDEHQPGDRGDGEAGREPGLKIVWPLVGRSRPAWSPCV